MRTRKVFFAAIFVTRKLVLPNGPRESMKTLLSVFLFEKASHSEKIFAYGVYNFCKDHFSA